MLVDRDVPQAQALPNERAESDACVKDAGSDLADQAPDREHLKV
jgi:hypothetical protein